MQNTRMYRSVWVYNQKKRTLQQCAFLESKAKNKKYGRIAIDGSILQQRLNIVDLKPASDGHHKKQKFRCHYVLFRNKFLAELYIDKIRLENERIRQIALAQ